MAQLTQALANALQKARAAADANQAEIVRAGDLTRRERETLLRASFLKEIMRGWYMLVRPDTADGDSAAWYANIWDFLRLYLRDRFGEDYCLSAEASIDLLTAKTIIPRQVIIATREGG